MFCLNVPQKYSFIERYASFCTYNKKLPDFFLQKWFFKQLPDCQIIIRTSTANSEKTNWVLTEKHYICGSDFFGFLPVARQDRQMTGKCEKVKH